MHTLKYYNIIIFAFLYIPYYLPTYFKAKKYEFVWVLNDMNKKTSIRTEIIATQVLLIVLQYNIPIVFLYYLSMIAIKILFELYNVINRIDLFEYLLYRIKITLGYHLCAFMNVKLYCYIFSGKRQVCMIIAFRYTEI